MQESSTGLVVVTVKCPMCGNRNRKARRACTGPCEKTGMVTKTVPENSIEVVEET